MKAVTPIILLLISCTFFFCSSKEDDPCQTIEKVAIISHEQSVPYIGNEHLKFLHNNTDTQIFAGQGKETYYIKDNNTIGSTGACPKDHECIKINFLNTSTNELFLYSYEFDEDLFTNQAGISSYTFYKFRYKNKLFYKSLYFSNTDTVIVNNKPYNYVRFIGKDTSNYVAKGITGILRIRIDNENWDVIP